MQNRELQGSYIQAVAESYESQGSMDRKFSEMPLPQHGLISWIHPYWIGTGRLQKIGLRGGVSRRGVSKDFRRKMILAQTWIVKGERNLIA